MAGVAPSGGEGSAPRRASFQGLDVDATKKLAKSESATPQFQVMLEKLGVLTCVARTGKGVKAVQMQMAKQADRAMIGQVRLILTKIGMKIKTGMHSAGEPTAISRGLDNLFGPFWKEVEKSLLDSFILETGFQFKEYRKALGKHQAEAPSELIEWCRATLLHAMEPCDLSFWGRMRNPLYAAIFALFLFPLYGVDSICVITYWICQKKVDEYQLVNFIIKSKGLQFLTGGLMGGTIAFIKLFRCSTVADPHGMTGCWKKAPGVTKTFRFEFSLLMVRIVLVWITFLLLFNFETIEKWDKKRQAEAATSNPRRGLFSPTRTAGLMFVNWIFFGTNVLLTVKNIHEGVETGVNALDTVALNFLFITVPLNALLNVRRLRWYAAAVAAVCSIASIVYIVIKYNNHMLLNQQSLIASACYAFPIFLVLAQKQVVAMADDKNKMDKLVSVIKDLDSDGDGEVSKKELKAVFFELFPGASFDTVWDELDSDGSGSLTTKELANHFGMGHLVEGTAEEEEAELKKLSGGVGSMAELEAQLEELSQSELSGTAGGVMTYFLYWDLFVFTSVTIYAVLHASPFENDEWQVSCTLFFMKVIIGLGCLPFIVFKLPLITDALTHTRKTGYDRSGACVAMIPSAEIKKRFASAYMTQLLNRDDSNFIAKEKDCKEKISDKWDTMLGPSFTAEQTYKMLDKKYGSKVALKYKPNNKLTLADKAKKAKNSTEDAIIGTPGGVVKAAKQASSTAVNGATKTTSSLKSMV